MKTSALISIAFLLLVPAVPGAQENPGGYPQEECDMSLVLTEVKNSLELSGEQETAVSALYREYGKSKAAIMEEFPGDDENDNLSRMIKIRRLNREIEAKMIDILSPVQIEGFNLIMENHRRSMRENRQRDRKSPDMEVMKERLGLSAGQEERVSEILQDRSGKISLLMQGMKGSRGGFESMRGSLEEIDDETEKKLSMVLDEDQMKEYLKIRSEEREKRKADRRPRDGGGRRPRGGKPF